MSEATALQSQIGNFSSSFANGQAAVSDYVSNYDTTFFDDWNNKVAQVRQKGQTVASVGGGLLGLQIAGKAAYKKFYGDKSGGDEDGAGEGEAAGGEGTEGISGAGAGEGAADAGAGIGGDAASSGTTSTVVTQANIPEGAGGGADVSNLGDSGGMTAEQAANFTQGEAGDAAAGGEAGDAAATGATTTEATTTEAAAYSSSFDAAGDAAVSGVTEAVGAATAVGETAAAVGTVALEAVPIVGELAAVGFGLYELFHHHSPPKKPNPSQMPSTPVTASARAENVLPNVDGVVDAPASVAAF